MQISKHAKTTPVSKMAREEREDNEGFLTRIPRINTDERGFESGGGPPQSKTWRKCGMVSTNAKRLGVRQPSGALDCGFAPSHLCVAIFPD
jgi:hypothetical protein